MRADLCRSLLTLAALLGLARGVLADEPTRPTPSATEENPAVPAPGHSIHGEAFNEGPRQQAHPMPGMGKADFPATAADPEAQFYINQGVAQLHSFYYLEAERSFRQAAKIDPDCPIAYWGMAMANVNNGKRAKEFIQEAQKRAERAKISRREKLYIDALAAFYKEKADDKAHRQGLLLGLETIVQEFPEDLDARAWLAMVTWQNSSKDGIGSRQAVDTLLESVLAVEPLHPGAHHYTIHLWDGHKQDQALESAALFARSAPGIAHAWHMPGHTYTGLRRYADAAYQQEGSARVDHASMTRERTMPFEIHNYAHNNQWLATSLSHVGRAHDAIAIARDLVEQPRDPNKNGPNDGGSAQRSGRMRWIEVLVRYELWDALIDATLSGALDWTDIPTERKQKIHSLGQAYAARGDREKLDEQIAALKKLAEGDKDEDKDRDKNKKAPRIPGLDDALAELEGYKLLLDDQTDAAFERFAKARSMRGEAPGPRIWPPGTTTRPKAPPVKPSVEPGIRCRPWRVSSRFSRGSARRRRPRRRMPSSSPWPVTPTATCRSSCDSRRSWPTGKPPPTGPRLPRPTTPTDAAAANRIDLTTLGPLTWSPYPAEPFELTDTQEQTWSLNDHRGKNVLLIFYLGGSCAHCMQQLQLFGEQYETLRTLGTEVVAIGTDDMEATRALKNNDDDIKFPMPMLADPAQKVFAQYRVRDEFEDLPMHGTFLIDANGGVRYHRISADPFLDVEFIKKESERVNRLVQP